MKLFRLSCFVICIVLMNSLFAKSNYIELKDYLPNQKIELNDWKAQLGRIPDAEKINFDDSLWEKADRQYRWHGNYTDCWFRKEVVIPNEMFGKAVYFQVTVDSKGELFVNEKSAGTFGWSKTILLTASAKAGDSFLIAIHGISDTVFGILIGASIFALDAGHGVLQQKVEQLARFMEKCKLPLNEKWKFHSGDNADYKNIDIPDQSWDIVDAQHTWWDENHIAWYRKTITLPERINEYEINGASVALDFSIEDKCDLFINGEKIGFYENYGSCILTKSATVGEKFTIAVRVIKNRNRGRLRRAHLRLDEFSENLKLTVDKLTEAGQLMERLPRSTNDKITFADKIADHVLNAANKPSVISFLKKFKQSDKQFDQLNNFFAKYPLQIKGPYLQNVNKHAITIMWETNVPSDSRVYYGLTDQYGQEKYEPEKVTIHRIRLTGLKPEQLYHYRIQSGKTASSDNTFRTEIHETTPFKFVVYGDSRSDPVAHEQVVNAIIKEKPDIVANVGDVVGTGRYEEWGREHFYPIRNLSKNTPTYIAIGNHEYNVATSDRRVIWFEKLVDQPNNKYWYSINYGNAHFIFLDTAKQKYPTDVEPGSEQYQWLMNDLQSDSCANAKWRFVFMHHPVWSEGWSGGYYDGEELLQKKLAPLFEKYNVDMVFQGHTHDYEFGRWPKEDGPCYLIVGGGGASLDDTKYREWKQVDKIVFDYHYCTIEINDGQLKFRAVDTFGNVFDKYKLEK